MMGGYASVTCYDLSRSVEVTLLANDRAMLATEEMKDAATLMSTAVLMAQSGDAAAGARYTAGREQFERNLREQSMDSAGTSRAWRVEAVDDAFRAQNRADNAFFDAGALSGQIVDRETATAGFNTMRALGNLADFDHRSLKAELARVGRTTRTTIALLLWAMVGAVLLSVFLSFRLSRSLLQPVKLLTTSAVALGNGALDRDVPVLSHDELGELAIAFNAMAAKLREFRATTTAKILRAQRTMEATLTSSPDPVFVLSKDGRIELQNPAAKALANDPGSSDGIPSALREPLAEVLATGNHYLPTGYDRVVTLRVDHEDRYYLPRILSVGDTLTGFGGAAILLQEVTQYRLMDDAKNNLVGTVSHELKTPLTSLRMAVYLLLEQNVGKVSATQQVLLETARDGADRLLRILDDLLNLSRLEGGATSLNLSPEQIDHLLAASAGEIKPLLDAANQQLVVTTDCGSTEVKVDRDRIRHVFVNLLANASKFSPSGAKIVLHAEPADDRFMRFSVRDDGPGIPAENLARVFEKFYRVPGQVKHGAGLGLAIAREIVIAHGGSIACTSEPGHGAEFYFLLPR